MAGLLVKDFKLILKRKSALIMFLLISLLLSYSSDSEFTLAYSTFLLSLFAIGTISYDEADNGLSFLMTLPITSKIYAISKYVLSVITCIIAWLIGLVISGGMGLIKGDANALNMGPTELLLPLALVLTISTVMVPIQFKFGVEKMRVVLAIIFGVIAVAVFGIEKVVDNAYSSTIGNAVLWISNNEALFCGIVEILAVVAFVISCFISIGILDKKEY